MEPLSNEDEKKIETITRYAKLVLFSLACLLVLAEFLLSPARALLLESFKPKYGDNPAFFKERFAILCNTTGNVKVCESLSDPSVDNSYKRWNSELCKISLVSDWRVGPTPSEMQAIQFRCNTIR